ncbi:transporter substrate-binding domain-containing protein [Alphaproteobacteria bacterium HT1-32]|nr:transporter substrate-binding domain-containing protein [Alphaproteobacteria bacterium HT1-32]
MKRIALIAAAAALTFSAQALAQDYKKITIATEGAYAPWNFKDSAGNLVGFELDLAKDLCARMKIECTIVEQAWDGIIPSLQAKKYDVIMAGMSITAKRMETITFSRDYAATPGSFVVTKDSPFADFSTSLSALTLDDVSAEERADLDKMIATFKGKTIGVQTSTTHENFLREIMGDNVDIRTYDTQENLDLDLQAGRVDAALASMSYWVPLLASDKGSDMKLIGPGMTRGPFGAGVGAGIRKEDQKLADMFTAAINSAIADGTLKPLAEKWFGFDAAAK